MDIRKYFGGDSGSGGSGAPNPSEDDKPSHTSPQKEEQQPEPSPAEAPAKSPAAKSKQTPPASASKRQKTTTPGSSKKKKTKTTPKVDADGDIDLVDSDFEIELSEEEEESSDSDDGFIVEDEDEGLEEEMEEKDGSAASKKRKKASSATPKSKSKAKSEKKSASAAKPKAKKTPGGAKKLPAALQMIKDDPIAMAAVAAVDAAAEKLPPEGELGMTLMAETGGFGGRPEDEPPRHGEVEPPRGHPDCLTGKTFVISGILDSLTREEASDLIKRHGGKVTGAVSGRTSFLVVGQQTGRTKYQNARTNGVKMINEAGLIALVAAAPAPAAVAAPPAAAAAAPPAAAAPAPAAPAPAPVAAAGAGSSVPTAGFYGASAGASGSKPLPPPAAAPAPVPPRPRPSTGAASDGQLWVEKWRPKTAADLVGNIQTVATLRHWLREWEPVHLHKAEPTPPPNAGARAKEKVNDMKKKAVILSGSPGIGKTSSAAIIAKELGFEPVEVNASDARNKADASVLKGVAGKLANSVKELTTNSAMSFSTGIQRKKLVLIMDEVDGMSASDRGGVADLIKTISHSKIPIICICNDKYSPKLRSLRNHCMELDFKKPGVLQISKRMMEICAAEGLSINKATMDELVQSANGGDIRLILGQLQMIRLRATSLSYDEVKSGGHGTAKDLEMSPFEAAKRLLDSNACSGLSLADQIELVFQDSDLVPLLVQENYLNHRPNIATNELVRLNVYAKAAEGFSAGDVANRSVRQYQNWSLMPFAAVMGTVNPATYCRGPREIFGLYPTEMNFPRFTAWLGNYSSGNKQRRLLGELHTRMLSSGAIECDRTALRLNYLPLLRNCLTRPLVQRGKEGIPEVLGQMKDYCISREDIDYIADVTKFKTKGDWGADPFKPIETQVKSAFTRAFNAQHLMPKTGFGMEESKKKRGGGKRGAAATADEEEEDVLGGGGEGEEGAAAVAAAKMAEEEEEEEMDPVLLRKKLMGMKHAGMELTLKDGSQAKTGGKGGRGGGRGSRGGGRGGGRGGRGKK